MTDYVYYILETIGDRKFKCDTLATAESLQIRHGGTIYEVEVIHTVISNIPF